MQSLFLQIGKFGHILCCYLSHFQTNILDYKEIFIVLNLSLNQIKNQSGLIRVFQMLDNFQKLENII